MAIGEYTPVMIEALEGELHQLEMGAKWTAKGISSPAGVNRVRRASLKRNMKLFR